VSQEETERQKNNGDSDHAWRDPALMVSGFLIF
jgi:hypothetical protein